MRKSLLLRGSFSTLIFALALLTSGFQYNWKNGYRPPNGFVPDDKTAIRIAEAIWTPIYGEEQINKERPIIVELRDGVWFVRGTLQKDQLGGVMEAEISKKDGRIIAVRHPK
jgi:NTF2 fold immunity protein of polymorphic toxin system component